MQLHVEGLCIVPVVCMAVVLGKKERRKRKKMKKETWGSCVAARAPTWWGRHANELQGFCFLPCCWAPGKERLWETSQREEEKRSNEPESVSVWERREGAGCAQEVVLKQSGCSLQAAALDQKLLNGVWLVALSPFSFLLSCCLSTCSVLCHSRNSRAVPDCDCTFGPVEDPPASLVPLTFLQRCSSTG